MAAAALLGRLFPVTRAAGGNFLSVPLLNEVAVRFASRNRGSKCLNNPRRFAARHSGLKKHEGEFVHAGNILATQRVIRWHPGAHVGIGRNKNLFALEDGLVRFTKEVYVPHPVSDETTEVICNLPRGAVLYKTFINVVPKGEVGSFKLINML